MLRRASSFSGQTDAAVGWPAFSRCMDRRRGGSANAGAGWQPGRPVAHADPLGAAGCRRHTLSSAGACLPSAGRDTGARRRHCAWLATRCRSPSGHEAGPPRNEAARWFLDRGFVVIAAMRRGYGEAGGYWAEGAGRCPAVDYARAGLESARDIAATVEYAATLPFARPQGMVLVGQSAGGWGAIAYNATPHPRVTAIINMAGGRGGHQEFTANSNCRPDLLAAAAGQLAHGATTPMLWVYSENDSFFAPAISGGVAQRLPPKWRACGVARPGPFSNDGHRLFFGTGGSQIWGPMVERYLASRLAQ